jgi:hypothetical protein
MFLSMYNFVATLPYTLMLPFTGGGVPGLEDALTRATNPVIELLRVVFNIAIPLVAAAGAIYCIALGVKYAKADEQQEREKAKHALKNAIVGFVLIFILVVALRLTVPVLQNWVNTVAPQQ